MPSQPAPRRVAATPQAVAAAPDKQRPPSVVESGAARDAVMKVDPQDTSLPRLVGYHELTARTGLSADVFRRARQRGELTAWGSQGRTLFDPAEVAAWLRRPRRRRTARIYADGPAGLPGSRVHF